MANIDYDVPFFANTPDDTHCYQAAIRMILKYFEPKKDFSWDELDNITAKQPDMWTWSVGGLVWLQANGYEVINIEDFDYERLIAEKKNYLIEKCGQEVADEIIKHGNLDADLPVIKKFMQEVKTDNRIPDMLEIEKLLNEGFLIIANVNSNALNDQPGWVGHFVVIKGFNERGLILHDPGSPAINNRQVMTEQFTKSWAYPDASAQNIMAIRKI